MPPMEEAPAAPAPALSATDALEQEKLRLEILSLRKRWWQSPALASTLVASLVTIGLSWAGGLFDLRRDQIALETNRAKFERDQVNADIKVQETLKKSLEKDRASLELERTALNRDISALQRSAQEATDAALKANAALAEAQTRVANTNQALKAANGRLDVVQRQLKAVSAPNLEVNRILRADDEAYIAFHNRGPGPAIIRRIHYIVDDEEIPESSQAGARLRPVLEAMGINDESMYWFGFGANARLAAGDTQQIFWVSKNALNSWNFDRFSQATARLKIAICFCSVENHCDWVGYGGPTLQRLQKCA